MVSHTTINLTFISLPNQKIIRLHENATLFGMYTTKKLLFQSARSWATHIMISKDGFCAFLVPFATFAIDTCF